MRLSGGLLALGLMVSSLAASALALQRLRVEQANRAVEVVLDYPDVAQWASASGKTVAAWLRGFTMPFSVALTEGTLADWGMPVAAPTPTYLLSEARFQQAKRVLALKARVELQPPQDAPAVEVRSESGARFWVVGDPLAITQLGLGLDPVQVAQVQAGGKPIVARLINPQGITPLALRGSLLFAREQGASLLIFAGDQVLGYRPGLQATAHNIQANAMRFGAIEFAKQAGAGNLTQAIPQHTVRVHSIGLAESLLLSPGEIIDRLERAAQERNIRVLYLRAAGADTPTLRDILQQLERRLHRAGYAIRESGARPFEALQPPVWQFALVGLGVGVLAGWALTLFRRVGVWAFAPLALGVAFALLCLLPLGRKAVALAAALLFPTVGMAAMAWLAQGVAPNLWQGGAADACALRVEPDGRAAHRRAARRDAVPHQGRPVRRGEVGARATPTARAGVLHGVGRRAVGLLARVADASCAVGSGVACAGGAGRSGADAHPHGQRGAWRRARLGVAPARPAGEHHAGAPAHEGVPDWASRAGGRRVAAADRAHALPAAAMFLATIGQASMVNTFCHLHSPLLVSLQRTGWGILLGVGLGLLALGVLRPLITPTARPKFTNCPPL
jgi:hypothetical protein